MYVVAHHISLKPDVPEEHYTQYSLTVLVLPLTPSATQQLQCASPGLVVQHVLHALATPSLLVAAWRIAVHAHLALLPAVTMPTAQVSS